MSFFLQRFDYRSSQYHRPNQGWVCGRAALGNPCRLGPGTGGECRTIAECEPIKKGDRWACTRPETGGGKCTDGPLPDGSCCNKVPKCAPTPSVRTQRGQLVRWVVVAVVGILLIAGGGAFGAKFFNPGQLSSGHAEIANCGVCHTAFDGGPIAWIKHAFDVETDSSGVANCVACHQKKDGLPHNQTQNQLAAMTAATEANLPIINTPKPLSLALAAGAGIEVPLSATGKIACQVCHQEHKGLKANISQMSDNQCQACHTAVLPAFEKSHPFGDYPYSRRTRIQFDHISHIDKYFQDAKNVDKAPQTCRNCHVPDDQGKLMVLGGFQQNCAACHGKFIADKPVEMVALPGIDIVSLQDNESGAGEWPEYAESEEISPFLKVLLAGDEAFTEAWSFIQDDSIDLLDLEDAEPEAVAAAETVVWSIKELFYSLLNEGPSVIQERLEEAAGRDLSPAEVRDLVASIPLESLYAAQTRWFPNLFQEVEARRDGDVVSVPDDLPEEFEPEGDIVDSAEWADGGGWYIEDYSINYKLKGHGDQFIKAWLSLIAGADPENESIAAFSEALATSKSPGGCVVCHSVDRTADSATGMINWQGRRPEPGTVKFTEFVHAKHFSLIGDKGCATCHTLNPDADYKASFQDRNPDSFTSNFAPMESKTCATCHNPSKVVTTCSDCHNFHVGTFPPTTVQTEMTLK